MSAVCAVLVLVLAPRPVLATPPDAARDLAQKAERELRQDILPFWLQHARNPTNGGFVGAITQNMQVKADEPRGSLLTSRILWTFSAAHRKYPSQEYMEMARWAYQDLVVHFKDREKGGYYWTITAGGKPEDSRKQVYGQAFAIYALAEYYRATGDEAALGEAREVFALLEKHAHDSVNGGYFDVLDRDWRREDGAKTNVLGPGSKSQNSHIHILEAFSNLLRVWPDGQLKLRQRELIELMLGRIIDARHHLVLFMKDDWVPVSRECSYGHDIELSWLLVEAAEVLGDEALLQRCRAVAVDIARTTLAEGVDGDGAIVNEGGDKGITDWNKDWWPQAEAVVGFLNAYQISGDERFLAAASKTWGFIEAHVIDRKNGDWYESLNRDGSFRRGTKLSLWKCPYHNSRACLEIMQRVPSP